MPPILHNALAQMWTSVAALAVAEAGVLAAFPATLVVASLLLESPGSWAAAWRSGAGRPEEAVLVSGILHRRVPGG